MDLIKNLANGAEHLEAEAGRSLIPGQPGWHSELHPGQSVLHLEDLSQPSKQSTNRYWEKQTCNSGLRMNDKGTLATKTTSEHQKWTDFKLFNTARQRALWYQWEDSSIDIRNRAERPGS